MGNELQVLDERELFGKEFRIYGTAENPLFLAKDVANWIEHSNPSKMLNCVDDEEKTTLTISYSGNMTTNQLFLTEDGLYEVLMQSRKPIAKQFKKEVKNILKTIRKTGGYIPVKEGDDDSVIMARALLIAQKTIEEKDKQLKESKKDNMILKCENAKLKPKADFADDILLSPGTVTITQIAKDYGMSGAEMNNLLHKLRIQYKVNGQWVLYAKYDGKGYTKSCTKEIKHTYGKSESIVYTRWTQKGRKFLNELLKNKGIYPNIEKAEMNK